MSPTSRSLAVGGKVTAAWYHEAREGREMFDVVLALANEHDVRTQIAQRQDAVVRHATTSATWQSQLLRHIGGRDDCIRCRMRDVREVHMACSTATVAPKNGESRDAALPILPAASGLMLATALQRLQTGDLAGEEVMTGELLSHPGWRFLRSSLDRIRFTSFPTTRSNYHTASSCYRLTGFRVQMPGN